MNAKELYIELQDKKYDERPYSRMKDWGEGMEDNDESALYGFIDKKAYVVIKGMGRVGETTSRY